MYYPPSSDGRGVRGGPAPVLVPETSPVAVPETLPGFGASPGPRDGCQTEVPGPRPGAVQEDEPPALHGAIHDGVREVAVAQYVAPLGRRRLVGREEDRALADVPVVDDVEQDVGRVGAVGWCTRPAQRVPGTGAARVYGTGTRRPGQSATGRAPAPPPPPSGVADRRSPPPRPGGRGPKVARSQVAREPRAKGRPVAGRPVSDRPVAGRPVAGRPVARSPSDTAMLPRARCPRGRPAVRPGGSGPAGAAAPARPNGARSATPPRGPTAGRPRPADAPDPRTARVACSAAAASCLGARPSPTRAFGRRRARVRRVARRHMAKARSLRTPAAPGRLRCRSRRSNFRRRPAGPARASAAPARRAGA